MVWAWARGWVCGLGLAPDKHCDIGSEFILLHQQPAVFEIRGLGIRNSIGRCSSCSGRTWRGDWCEGKWVELGCVGHAVIMYTHLLAAEGPSLQGCDDSTSLPSSFTNLKFVVGCSSNISTRVRENAWTFTLLLAEADIFGRFSLYIRQALTEIALTKYSRTCSTQSGPI